MNEEQGNQFQAQSETASRGFDTPQENVASSVGTVSDIPPEPKQHRKLKIVLTVLGVLVVCVLFFPRVLTLVTSDIPEVDDADLIPSARVVADEDNGALLLEQIQKPSWEDLETAQNLLFGSVEWDQQMAEMIVENNTVALSVLEKLATMPDFQTKESADPAQFRSTTTLTSFGPLRDVARIKLLQAKMAFYSGNEQAALQHGLTLLDVGHVLNRPNNSLIQYLVSIALRNIAYSELSSIIASRTPATTSLAYLHEELLKHNEDDTSALKNVFMNEYVMLRNDKDMISVEGFREQELITGGWSNFLAWWLLDHTPNGNSFFLRKNQTLQLYANMSRASIQRIDFGCSNDGTETDTFIKNQVPPHVHETHYVTQNGVGKLLYSVTAASLGSAFEQQCAVVARNNLLRSAVAMLMYEIENGHLPESIDDIQAQVEGRTIDPFTGTQLSFIPSRRILYSVGRDRIDGGGVGDKENQYSGDLVVEF